MRVSPYEQSLPAPRPSLPAPGASLPAPGASLPAPGASLPAPGASLDVRAARALRGGATAPSAFFSGGRPERIVGPTFGIARQLELYRDNEATYTPPVLSRFHVFV